MRKGLFKLGIDHNVKLIALEKPLATNFNEAKEIYEMAKNAGVKFCVSHQQKYGDHYQAVKRSSDSGKLGRIQTIYGHVWAGICTWSPM